jgi:hypothetical protein
MRLSTWSPEYETKAVTVRKAKTGLKITVDDKDLELKPEQIAITVLGYVETFRDQYADVQQQIASTVSVLDSLDELGVKCQQFVGYKSKKDGQKFLGELAEFEGEVYQSNCDNPAIDTDIVEKLKDKRVVFVAGMPSEQGVMQYVTALNQSRLAGKLPNLEKVVVLDQCTTTIGDDREDMDYFAKYVMEQQNAVIAELYRGETRIA